MGEEDFDAATVCHDGAEICELVDTFILHKISHLCKNRTMLDYTEMIVWVYSKICRDPMLSCSAILQYYA